MSKQATVVQEGKGTWGKIEGKRKEENIKVHAVLKELGHRKLLGGRVLDLAGIKIESRTLDMGQMDDVQVKVADLGKTRFITEWDSAYMEEGTWMQFVDALYTRALLKAKQRQ